MTTCQAGDRGDYHADHLHHGLRRRSDDGPAMKAGAVASGRSWRWLSPACLRDSTSHRGVSFDITG
jgi:hypothetical protein